MCNPSESLILNNHESEGTDGFDVQAGLSWIYPTNYPLRDYQFNIIQHALFKNTLVSLPTGLGKTFIAAVVMYNFYRWYPTGKIIFMAPTRPLVKQQVDACYEIMAIPHDVTAELTGAKVSSKRNDIWMDKRVFFITPQILQNDLDSFYDLAPSIKCIVFDEAHKARKNHAYCDVIRKLKQRTKYFRVLALSATPGNNIDDVGEVINNLIISHMEFKTEESSDVKPYVFERKLESMVIPLGDKLEEVKAEYIEILERYARTLIKYKIIHGNCSTLTKGRIFIAKKEFQERPVRDPNYNEIIKTLNICMTLYHAYELLIRDGLRGFLAFYEEHIDKPLLRGNSALIRIMEDVRDYLGPLPNVEILPDGTYPEVPLGIKFGHPKFYKLREMLLSHFTNSEDNSRVIVFFEYRDSVKEAFIALLQARPLIRAKVFLGQKSGITQRSQLNVIKMFREGECNTLLSTSIGEEGLDVGEVDLIVCFDISNKSPIRMVQRMGRTGRRREGQVIVLVTEGKEQQTLNDCLFYKNNIKNWAGSTKILERFFLNSPRMVPEYINPECVKMQITVKKQPVTKKSTLKDMFNSIKPSSSILFQDVEIVELKERIAEPIALFNKSLPQLIDFDLNVTYNRYIENQRTFQGTAKIKTSEASELFVGLMKFADSKRFNIPLTQGCAGASQGKNLRQGNIKSMFMNVCSRNDIMSSQDDFATQKTQSDESSQAQNDHILQEAFKSDSINKALHLEISNYLAIELTIDRKCQICENLFKCNNVHNIVNDNKFLEDLKHWIPPDLNRIKNITVRDLELYEKLMSEEHREKSGYENCTQNVIDSDFISLLPNKKVEDKSFYFNAPKSLSKIINPLDASSTYASSQTTTKNTSTESSVEKLNNILKFFKLEKCEDIFESSNNNSLNNFGDSQHTIIYSDEDLAMQTCFENQQLSPVIGIKNYEPTSPILNCSFKSQQKHSKLSRCRKRLDTSDEENMSSQKRLKTHSSSIPLKTANSNEKELNQSKNESEDETLLGIFGTRKKSKNCKESQKTTENLTLEDFCDLSAFGFSQYQSTENQKDSSEHFDNIAGKSSNRLLDEDLHHENIFEVSMKIDAESTRIENGVKDHLHNNNINVNSDRIVRNAIVKNVNHLVAKKNEISHNLKNCDKTDSDDDFRDLSVIIYSNKENTPKLNNCNEYDAINSSTPSKIKTLSSKTADFQISDSVLLDLCDSFVADEKTPSSCLKESNSYRDKQVQLNDSTTTEKFNNNCATTVYNNERLLRNDDSIETVVIQDSPTKEDIMDLTLSPKYSTKSSNRKVLSQMSITQILSLASKQTQSSTSASNQKANTNLQSRYLNDSKYVENSTTTTKICKPKIENSKMNLSLLDDLNNFEEFNESFTVEKIKKSSPIFKTPNLNKANSKKAEQEQKSSTFKTKPKASYSKRNNRSLYIDSDEEFETPLNVSFSLNKSVNISKTSSDEEFETTFLDKKKKKDKKFEKPKKTKGTKKRSDFIELEADVSNDGIAVSDDEASDHGSFDESFVDDDTQNLRNDTQMHIKYLQSVKSPINGGKFKIPENLKPISSNIFSQVINNTEPDSYINDSFCVNTQNVDGGSHELSELEILEKELKEKRRKKRKEKDTAKKSKRRIIVIDSDSD